MAPAPGVPLQLDQKEGDSEWAGRMMSIDSGAVMRCIGCSCPGASCKGSDYRVDAYVGKVLHMAASGWTWIHVPMKPTEIDVMFPRAFPGHRWRNVATEDDEVV